MVFTLLYWLVFSISPDAFNFSLRYSSNPLSAFLGNFYTNDNPVHYTDWNHDNSISRFEKLTASVQVKFDAAAKLKVDAARAEREYNLHVKAQMAKTEDAIREYEKTNMGPIQKRVDELKVLVADQGISPTAKVSYLQEEILLNEKMLKYINHTIYGRLSFADAQDLAKERELDDQRNRANDVAYRADSEFRDERVKLTNAYAETRREFVENIGFWDFVYFSACVSTTTTFGDITANERWLRLIVIAQIFSGIVILSLALSRLKIER
ncbi:two pore domain potassium channel family protein [Cohaesibacter sp. CAU 1516]|uniref:potassium channel family protein n=1 Tax=Cohaesibacter sp. CAU 1516 TaxID=2576038 RepID=UPI0010FDAD69|nr:potassium channel family protein [Cohaesibacter sp. CAU 1516]TLP49324.1 two pore domain potassium channel family protein [Cohaesibacter sp. CAU 1516]